MQRNQDGSYDNPVSGLQGGWGQKGQWGMALNTGRCRLDILYCEGDEALEWVVQMCSGFLTPRSVQGSSGWGPEQPGLVNYISTHGREVMITNYSMIL